MADNSISQIDGSSIQGTYEIISAELFTNQDDKNSIDIRGIIDKIIVKESIYSAGIGVEIRIIDGISLLDSVKLLGNEKIFLILIQKGIDVDIEKKFSVELFISNITNFARPKPGLDAYSFICVSKHVYSNQFSIMDDGFDKDIGDNIKNICRGKLNIPENLLDIDSGFGTVKGVYPSLKPIEAIRFQMRGADEYLYFYEDLKGIKHLHAHKDLIKKEPIGEYTTSPFYQNEQGTEANYLEQKKKVLSFSSNLDVSKLAASSNGVYSSQTTSLDISIKEHKQQDHRGFKKDLLNKAPTVSKNAVVFDFADQPQSKRYYHTVNSKAFDNNNNINKHKDLMYLKESYKHDLNTHKVRIVTYGNLDVQVGNTILLLVPPTGQDDNDQILDGYFTGKYIITDITHNFESDYQTEMTIKKDSFFLDTDENRVIVERVAGGSNERTGV